MAFNREIVPNPLSKGHLIERRTYHIDGEDLARAKRTVPFELGKPATALCWWQRDTNNGLFFMTGVPEAKHDDRIINPLLAGDRGFIPGDAPETLFEIRRFANLGHKNQMLKVCPPQPVSGFSCSAWWELSDPNDAKSAPVLCSGLIASTEDTKAELTSGDGLDHLTKNELLTIAGKAGIRDANKSMPEGEIIAKIRAKKGEKSQKHLVAATA